MTKEINSRMLLDQTVQKFYLKNTSFPYKDLIKGVVRKHMQAIDIDIGRLDLCYLRTKQKAKND